MMTFFKRLESTPWLAEAAALLFGLVYTGWGLFFAHTSDSLLDEGAYLYNPSDAGGERNRSGQAK